MTTKSQVIYQKPSRNFDNDNQLGNWNFSKHHRLFRQSQNITQTKKRAVRTSTEDEEVNAASENLIPRKTNPANWNHENVNKTKKFIRPLKVKSNCQLKRHQSKKWNPRPNWKLSRQRKPETNDRPFRRRVNQTPPTALLALFCDSRPEDRVSYLHWERSTDSELFSTNDRTHSSHNAHYHRAKVPHRLPIEATAGDFLQN